MGNQIRISAPTAEGAIHRLLDICNPSDIATAVDLFIERLDQMAGDPDLEENGDEEGPGLFAYRVRDEALSQLAEHRDAAIALATEDDEDDDPAEDYGDELDGSLGEDDFCSHSLAYPGPGCPVSDGGCSTGSGAGDPAWAEWHTRGRHKVGKFGEEQCRRRNGNMAREDDEDDDPVEENGDEQDTGNAEDDELSASARHWGDYWNGERAGCPISDPGGGPGEEATGDCVTFGIDQTREVSEVEAFHDRNAIPLIRVPLPENDQ